MSTTNKKASYPAIGVGVAGWERNCLPQEKEKGNKDVDHLIRELFDLPAGAGIQNLQLAVLTAILKELQTIRADGAGTNLKLLEVIRLLKPKRKKKPAVQPLVKTKTSKKKGR